MKALFIVLVLPVIVVLNSWATPYQSSGATGGFQNQRISTNQFLVDFAGNGFTSKKKTNDFALLRAAEITKEYQFNYFTIEGDRDLSRSERHYSGSTSRTTGYLNSYGSSASYSGYTTTTPQVTNIYKPGSQLRIKCYVNKPTGHVGRIFTADQVIVEMKSKHKIE